MQTAHSVNMLPLEITTIKKTGSQKVEPPTSYYVVYDPDVEYGYSTGSVFGVNQVADMLQNSCFTEGTILRNKKDMLRVVREGTKQTLVPTTELSDTFSAFVSSVFGNKTVEISGLNRAVWSQEGGRADTYVEGIRRRLAELGFTKIPSREKKSEVWISRDQSYQITFDIHRAHSTEDNRFSVVLQRR